jgi:hypothetical protein
MGPLLHAFFDEAGDEGLTGKSTPWLCIGGWVVPEAELDGIKKFLAEGAEKVWRGGNKPPSHIHFQQIASHAQRKALLKMLCGLNFTALSTVAHKQSFRKETLAAFKCPTMFNFVAKHALERVSWLGKSYQRTIAVTFASRAEDSWAQLKKYIEILRGRTDHQIHFNYIHSITNTPANVNSLVQAADWISSSVANGLNPDKYGNVECGYAEILWGKFWNKNGKFWTYGMKVLPYDFDRKNEELFRKIDTRLDDPTSIT